MSNDDDDLTKKTKEAFYLISKSLICSTRLAATLAIFLNLNLFTKEGNQEKIHNNTLSNLFLNLLLGCGLISRQKFFSLVYLPQQLVGLPHLLSELDALALDVTRLLEVAGLLERLVGGDLGSVHPGLQLLVEAVQELLLILHISRELDKVDGVDVGLVVDQAGLALGKKLGDLWLARILALFTLLNIDQGHILICLNRDNLNDLVELHNVKGLALDLHGPDDLLLGVGVAVQDVGDLVPAGLDGRADPLHLLQGALVRGRGRHKVLLKNNPLDPEWHYY